MKLKTVGIIGHGAFGGLVEALLRRFAPSVGVRVYSSRHAPDGERFHSLEEASQSDAVVLAVPISAFEPVLEKVLPHMRADTILVDVATVKMHTTEVLKRRAGSQPYIATHPMWGPESYEKKVGDVSGFRIVVTESTIPEPTKVELLSFLRDVGFDVVEMTSEQHDKHLAESLFLTHFIGQIVARAGFDRTEIDTVSFGYLMDAVESVKHDAQLFADVFACNPYCAEILQRFGKSEEEVRHLLEK
ncbi:MAG: putative prephenate dehydrogenase [Parcubacteria group bacterium Athens0416_74]|nr:MAG: putative prephenate dehydrogenase [Parcubacteria group bacterium Athens0416_74]